MPDVGVSELFRFRTTRSIQHKDASSTAYVIPETNLPPAVEDLSFVLGQFSWIQGVSTQIALSADYLTPQQVIALLPNNWQAQLAQKDADNKPIIEDVRAALHGQIVLLANQCRAIPPVAGAYGVSVVPPELAAQAEEYCRALLTLDLLVTLDETPGSLVSLSGDRGYQRLQHGLRICQYGCARKPGVEGATATFLAQLAAHAAGHDACTGFRRGVRTGESLKSRVR